MRSRILTILIMLTAVATMCSATDYLWTNGSGDHDFTRGSNWWDTSDSVTFTDEDDFNVNLNSTDYAEIGINDANAIGYSLFIGDSSAGNGEVRVTGGESHFEGHLRLGNESDGYGKLVISDGEITFLNSWMTVGNDGTGEIDISGGTLRGDRMNIANKADSYGSLTMIAGLLELTGSNFYLGVRGDADAAISGGTLYSDQMIGLGAFVSEANGVMDISGDAVVESGLDLSIGRKGQGTINMSGGELIANRMNLGEYTGDSIGELNLSNGEVDVAEYVSIGKEGAGSINLSGGAFRADRLNLGQESTGVGELVLSGGTLDLYSRLEIGRDGVADLTIEGAGSEFKCGWLDLVESAAINFAMDGSSGVGSGILIRRAEADIMGDINPYFMSGTETGGSFLAMTAIEGINDACSPGMLSSSAESAGWSSEIIGLEGYHQALLLNYPISGSDVSWTNGGSDQLWSTSSNWDAGLSSGDRAIIDIAGSNGAILNSSVNVKEVVIGDVSDGSLNVNTGASGQFTNLTLADANTSTGELVISDGLVDVASVALLGINGDSDLTMTGGEFYAGSILSGLDPNGNSDISISGDAVFYADGLLDIGDGGNFTMSGWQSDVNVGSLFATADSEMNFELDGGAAVGPGMFVAGDVDLYGTVDIGFLNQNVVDGTYTLIRSEGVINDHTGGDLMSSPIIDYDIVEDGQYQKLQITVTSPQTCEDVIDAGGQLAGDLNADCKVDFEDFAIMSEQWLWCNDPEGGPQCDWMTGLDY